MMIWENHKTIRLDQREEGERDSCEAPRVARQSVTVAAGLDRQVSCWEWSTESNTCSHLSVSRTDADLLFSFLLLKTVTQAGNRVSILFLSFFDFPCGCRCIVCTFMSVWL